MKNKAKGGDKMFKIVLYVLSYLSKNVALLVGIIETLFKVIAGIVSLTPTKKDDAFIPQVDKFFSAIKKVLYNVSDFMAGKELPEQKQKEAK